MKKADPYEDAADMFAKTVAYGHVPRAHMIALLKQKCPDPERMRAELARAREVAETMAAAQPNAVGIAYEAGKLEAHKERISKVAREAAEREGS